MKVMLDTNVLISGVLFGTPTIVRTIEHIAANHELLLSDYVVNEFLDVVGRKWPTRLSAAKHLLAQIAYEKVALPQPMDMELFDMRDQEDYPVLYGAYIGFADVLVTGDKDFQNLGITEFDIVTPAEYLMKYESRHLFG